MALPGDIGSSSHTPTSSDLFPERFGSTTYGPYRAVCPPPHRDICPDDGDSFSTEPSLRSKAGEQFIQNSHLFFGVIALRIHHGLNTQTIHENQALMNRLIKVDVSKFVIFLRLHQ